MSEYGLRVKKGDFELSLNSDDAPWIAQEISLWRDALLTGQLARALGSSSATAAATPSLALSRPPGFVPKFSADSPRMASVLVTSDEPLLPDNEEASEEQNFSTVFSALMDEVNESAPRASTDDRSPEPSASLNAGKAQPIDEPSLLPLETLTPRFTTVSTAGRRAKTTSTPATLAGGFRQWFEAVPPVSQVQSLLWAGFYRQEYEQRPKFSLKEINQLLSEAGQPSVNHTNLQDALDENWLELVQDVDDITTISEYQLTLDGIEATRKARKIKPKATPKARK